MATNTLPPLLHFNKFENLEPPILGIRTDNDVLVWKQTTGYQNFMLFLRRLSEAVVDHYLPIDEQSPSLSVKGMVTMLDKLDSWIDEIPPLPTPQRFGNLAFRTWGQRLEDNAYELMKELLPESLYACVDLLKPYFVISFGSFTRMDYGTGHEAAFGILLMCLTLIRFFLPEPAEERSIVLIVFLRYIRLCWKLQDTYRLEPAGSHGVWGLDDSSFLGYVFGSAQLLNQKGIPVNAALRPNLPPTNLYFLSISRIHEVKTGPFHEHSSQLHSIAVGVPNWGKVHSGLLKMYEAEVLGKRVVVQHIPVGGLLQWDRRYQQPTALMAAPSSISHHTDTTWAASRSHPMSGVIHPSTSFPTSFPRPTSRVASAHNDDSFRMRFPVSVESVGTQPPHFLTAHVGPVHPSSDPQTGCDGNNTQAVKR